MLRYAGICDFQGYGFVKSMYEKYNLNKNIVITNFGDFPSSASYFYKINNENNSVYEILINITEEKFKNIFKTGRFKIIEKKDNCYFVKKND